MATIARPRIGPADHGRRMTLEEFRDAEEEEGFRYELARGVLDVTEVPNDEHGVVVCNLYELVAIYRRAHPGVVQRFGGGADFRLWLPGMVSGRNPDLAVVLQGAPKDRRDRRIPALAMEVVSEGAEARERDYVVKRAEYLAYGLLEYWIVDPIARRVTVLTRDGDVWVERGFGPGQTASGLVLPNFAVPVDDLWAGIEDEDEGDSTAIED